MAYASWDPFREIDVLRREVDRIFESQGLDRWTFPFSRFSFLPGRSARTYPLINISDDPENYYLEALAPGLNTEGLKVTVVDNQLTIQGEKLSPGKDVKAEAWHRNERGAGRFQRTLKLPGEVEQDKVQASYASGLLRITLPKAEATRPRQVAVAVA